MRLAMMPIAAALVACVTTAPSPAPSGTGDGVGREDVSLEAYCMGGIAGMFDHIVAAPDGTIRAARSATADPMPIVANDPGTVNAWLAEAFAANPQPVDGPGYAPYPFPDAIVCGVILHAPDSNYVVEAPALHEAMMLFLPAPG